MTSPRPDRTPYTRQPRPDSEEQLPEFVVPEVKLGCGWKLAGHGCKMLLSNMVSALGLYILYLIFLRPYAVRPRVDDAALAAFDLAPSNDTLRYDLALNVTFWNDHRIWDIRYNHFTARLHFNGTQLSPPDDTYSKFKSKTRRHRTLHPLLRGRASNVGAAVAEEFWLQRAHGWFVLEVSLRARLTYIASWPVRVNYYYEFECWLHFPTNATAPAVVQGVKCSKGKRFALS